MFVVFFTDEFFNWPLFNFTHLYSSRAAVDSFLLNVYLKAEKCTFWPRLVHLVFLTFSPENGNYGFMSRIHVFVFITVMLAGKQKNKVEVRFHWSLASFPVSLVGFYNTQFRFGRIQLEFSVITTTEAGIFLSGKVNKRVELQNTQKNNRNLQSFVNPEVRTV